LGLAAELTDAVDNFAAMMEHNVNGDRTNKGVHILEGDKGLANTIHTHFFLREGYIFYHPPIRMSPLVLNKLRTWGRHTSSDRCDACIHQAYYVRDFYSKSNWITDSRSKNENPL
jgi:hypothetical protein